MSISASLNNALSGLVAASRAADVVSSNVANAMTDGYGVRGLDLGALTSGRDGSGVRVLGVVRDSDPVLTGQRRGADAAQAKAGEQAAFLRQLEGIIGLADDPSSLSARLAEFEARLVDAANGPQDDIRLGAAVEAAEQLASGFRDASASIQSERERADTAIGAAISKINQSLEGIVDLNRKILSTKDGSGDMAALLDAQARFVDQLSPLISIETRRDANGALQVFSTGGEILVDRRAAVLEFQTTPAIEPTMIYGASILSGVTINGRDVPFDVTRPQLGGGELEALFSVRDTWGPEAQARLDGVARDLIERFETPGLDNTLAPTAAGLFTDGGARSDAALEMGLSARLMVNGSVRPDDGGAVWRLRDGIGATTEGPTGDAALLVAQVDILSQTRVTASTAFSASARSMADLVSDHISTIGLARQSADQAEVSAATVQSALRQQELARGVDTDAEMQNLIRIEQMYAANARVVQAAEAMLDELMRMTR
jgi:flagellar hook-associated protein 1 FlgK